MLSRATREQMEALTSGQRESFANHLAGWGENHGRHCVDPQCRFCDGLTASVRYARDEHAGSPVT